MSTWTYETPKVTGFYFNRMETRPTEVYVKHVRERDIETIAMHPVPGEQWSSEPIPLPKEPKEPKEPK